METTITVTPLLLRVFTLVFYMYKNQLKLQAEIQIFCIYILKCSFSNSHAFNMSSFLELLFWRKIGEML